MARIIQAHVEQDSNGEYASITMAADEPLRPIIIERVAQLLNEAGRYQECDEVRRSLKRDPLPGPVDYGQS